jgi:hypothetical protein
VIVVLVAVTTAHMGSIVISERQGSIVIRVTACDDRVGVPDASESVKFIVA